MSDFHDKSTIHKALDPIPVHPIKVEVILSQILWSPSQIGWSIWYQGISSSCGPVTGKTKISLPHLGLTLTRILGFDYGCMCKTGDAYPS